MGKEKSIAEHKEDDARLIRKRCLKIIENDKLLENATGAKAIVEAAKLLARAQHLLQVDKQVIREAAQKRQKIDKPELRPEHAKRLKDIING